MVSAALFKSPSVSIEMVEVDRQPFLWISSSKLSSDHFHSASTGALLWLFLEVVGGFGHTFVWDAG